LAGARLRSPSARCAARFARLAAWLDAQRGDLRGPAVRVVLGCLVCQIGLGFGYVFGPLLADITEELGLSRAAFSSARLPLLFVISAASPLLGWAVLRFGARAVVTTSTLMLAVSFWWGSRAQSLWDLYLANLVLGLATTGLGDISVGAVVAQWVSRGRGLALGIVYTGSNLGGMVLAPLATWLAARGSWRQALLVIGLAGALFILPFALFAVRERRGSPDDPAAEPAAPGQPPAPESGDLTAGQALRTRSFWILAVATFSFFFYFLAILEHFVAALTDAGVSRQAAATWYSAAIGMGLVSKIAMGLFADRLSPRLAILTDYGLLAASSLLMLAVPAPGFLPVFVATFGFAYAARDVVTPLAIAECFGVRYLATIYGAVMVVLAPAGTLGGIFAGWCFDATGSYHLAFQVFAAINLLVFVSLFWLRSEVRETASPR
jgi:predicted MFS family arabinose efflux permease